MAATLSSALKILIQGDMKGFEKEIGKVDKKIDQALNNAKNKTKTTSGSMIASWNLVGFSVSNIINKMKQLNTAIFETGVAFDQEFAAISSLLTDEAPSNIAKLRKEAIQLGDALGKSPVDVAKALYVEISAGAKDAGDDLTKFTEQVIKAATAGRAGIDATADAFLGVINTYGLTLEDATRVSDNFFNIVKFGKTTLEGLAKASSRVVPIAKAAGVEMEDWGAAIAVLTQSGFSTDKAFTGVRAVIQSLLKPTAGAREEAKRLGIDFSAAALRAKGLVGVMNELRAKVTDTSRSLPKLFANQRAFAAASVFQGSDRLQMRVDQFTAGAGATEKAYAAMTKSIQFNIDKMKAAFTAFSAETIGNAKEELSDFFKEMRGGIKDIAAFAKETNIFVVALSGIRATVKYIQSGVLGLIQLIVDIGDAFYGVWTIVKGVGTLIYNSMAIVGRGIALIFNNMAEDFSKSVADMAVIAAAVDPSGTMKEYAREARNAQFAAANAANQHAKAILKLKAEIGETAKEMANVFEFDPASGRTTPFKQSDYSKALQRESEDAAKESAALFKKAYNEYGKARRGFEEEVTKITKEQSKKRKDLYSKEAVAKREAAFQAERKIQAEIERINRWTKTTYRDQTKVYISELKRRESAAKSAEDKLLNLRKSKASQYESFEERLWAITMTGLTDAGKLIQRFGIADTFETRSKRAVSGGNFTEARRLAEKAQSAYENIALDSSVSKDERNRAKQGFLRTQKMIERNFKREEAQAKYKLEEQKARIADLSKRLSKLQEQGVIKLRFLIDNNEAIASIDRLKKALMGSDNLLAGTKSASNIKTYDSLRKKQGIAREITPETLAEMRKPLAQPDGFLMQMQKQFKDFLVGNNITSNNGKLETLGAGKLDTLDGDRPLDITVNLNVKGGIINDKNLLRELSGQVASEISRKRDVTRSTGSSRTGPGSGAANPTITSGR